MTRTGRFWVAVLASGLAVSMVGPAVAAARTARPSHRSRRRAAATATAAFPDFNGDGFADLAVGSIFEDVQGSHGVVLDAGAVDVLYGSAAGLQATGTGGPDDQVWNEGDVGLGLFPHEGDHFGFATAAGDYNADGYDDLAIGIELSKVNGVNFAGSVVVLYGSPTGLQATGTGGPAPQGWTEDTPGMNPDIGGAQASDSFGRALTAGDYNGDGFADLAVGIRGKEVDGARLAGAVSVIYGSNTGLQDTGTGGPDDQYWTQDSPSVKDRAEPSDFFGRSLASGDFNDDGYVDLVVGAYAEDIASVKDAGAVNVIYGSASGLQATATGGPDDQFWFQGENGLSDMAEPSDVFGRALAVGDFNGDGITDLAVGARREGIINTPEAGAVNVIYGSATGLQATGTGGPDDQFWYQGANGMQKHTQNHGWFGNALAAGDFNGDGYADLAIGSRRRDINGVENAGSVSVLYGSSTGLQATGTGGPDDQFWAQGSDGLQDQPEAGDTFGFSLAASDFNADGFPDLAVGAAGEDLEAQAVTDAGAVQVLYATSAGLQADSPDDQFWTQDSPGMADQARNGNLWGWSLGASTP